MGFEDLAGNIYTMTIDGDTLLLEDAKKYLCGMLREKKKNNQLLPASLIAILDEEGNEISGENILDRGSRSDDNTGLTIATFRFLVRHIDFSGQYSTVLEAFKDKVEDTEICKQIYYSMGDYDVEGTKHAMMWASEEGHLNIVKLLLKSDWLCRCESEDGGNALLLACEYGHWNIVKLFLEKEQFESCNLAEVLDGWGCNVFLWASLDGQLDIVRLLLESNKFEGCNQAGSDGNAFSFACYNGHVDVAALLLESSKFEGCNFVSDDGYNGFLLAAQEGHLDIVEVLLESHKFHGCNHTMDESHLGFNAFLWASQEGHLGIARLLLENHKFKGVNVVSVDGYNALTIAANDGNVDIVRLLLASDRFEGRTHNGRMVAACAASKEGHLDIAKLLLERSSFCNVLPPAPPQKKAHFEASFYIKRKIKMLVHKSRAHLRGSCLV